MTKTVPAVKARQQLGTLLNEVTLEGTNVVIERDGKPVAVMVPVAEFESWQRKREAARARFLNRAERVSERVAQELEREGKTQEDLEQLICDETRAARRKSR